MNFYELIQLVGQNVWIYGGSFILVLSILVFVHEWGHYIVARMCGVRVEQFSIGFGKEIWGFHDKAGTRWKVSLIPLGGYVQLFGDTDPASAGHTDDVKEGEDVRPMTDAEREVAFFNKPIWKRSAIVFAGPAINYIFAVMLLAGLFAVRGQPVSPPTAAAIMGGSSAEQYGFQPHDYLISIDGKKINDFSDIRREMLVALDQEKLFVIDRKGARVEIYAKPTRKPIEDNFGFKSSIGVLGVLSADQGIQVAGILSIDGKDFDNVDDIIAELKSRMGTTFTIEIKSGKDGRTPLIINPVAERNQDLGTEEDQKLEALYLSNLPPRQFTDHNFMTATQSAIRETYVMTVSSVEALWQMVTGVRSATELGGIVRIGAIAGETAQKGIVPLILLTALLSINLGFINLLPIPMLDGGHLTFYAVEAVIGRPVPELVQEYAFRAGFVFLIGIMAFANLNDIYQLLT